MVGLRAQNYRFKAVQWWLFFVTLFCIKCSNNICCHSFIITPAVLTSILQHTTVTVAIKNKSLASSPSDSHSTSSILENVQVVDSMPDPLPTYLSNSYYLLRHGQSTANIASVISSCRKKLAYTDVHDVTPLGYQQGFNAASALVDLLSNQPHKKLVFVSSPFARARSTAQACLEGLLEIKASSSGNNNNTTTTTQDKNDKTDFAISQLDISPDVVLKDELVERYFGRLDGAAIYTYAYVWPLDSFNVTHTAFGVESVAAVCHRLRQLILALEQEYSNHIVVLVSHADVLQILQLYASGAPNVGAFSSFRFQNGEVRYMATNTTEYLPEARPLPAPVRGTRVININDNNNKSATVV